jgi:hypothetical protein
MKKLSVISPVLFLLFVILAFTVNNTPEVKDEVSNSQYSIVNFHIKGCLNCDYVGYCLDGAGFVKIGTCDFSIKCNDDKIHTICIRGTNCTTAYTKGVSRKFSCKDGIQDIYIDCNENCDCECIPKDK